MTGYLLPLVVTFAVQIQASLVVFTPPVLAPAAEPDIGVSAAAVGIVIALIYVTSVPSALLSGHVLARMGAIRVSQLCLLFISAGMALMAIPSPWLIALGALVIGIGYGAVTPASSSVLADRVPDGLRAFIFSIKQSGVPIGGAIAGALVPILILVSNWQRAALAIAVIGAAVVVAMQSAQRGMDASHAKTPSSGVSLLEPLRLVMSHPRLRELAISSFTFSGMQMCLGSYLVVALVARAGFSLSAAGAALSVAMLAGAVGRPVFGVMADRWIAPRRLLGWLGLGMSVGSFLTAAISTAWPVTAIYLLALAFGAAAVGWNGVYLAEVARIAPAGRAGAATGASLAMTYSGVVVLPLLFWGVYAATGSYAAPFTTIGLLSLWRGLTFFTKEKVRRRPDEDV